MLVNEGMAPHMATLLDASSWVKDVRADNAAGRLESKLLLLRLKLFSLVSFDNDGDTVPVSLLSLRYSEVSLERLLIQLGMLPLLTMGS